MRRGGWLMALAILGAGGCQGQTMDQWIKEKITPAPTAVSVARIESDKPDERREALQNVAKDPEARKTPSVVKLFCMVAETDADPLVRAAAVRGLAAMEGDGVIVSLGNAATGDQDRMVRCDAAAALGMQGKPECVPPLAQVLAEDADADVRIVAAEALARFKDRAAAHALVGSLRDGNLAVSEQSWESLRYMTGQNLPREASAWTDFLASTDKPFAAYGKPPPRPKGVSQRPQFTKGVDEFIKGLFAKDVREAELE